MAAADPVAADQVRVGGLEVVRGDDVPVEDAVGAPGASALEIGAGAAVFGNVAGIDIELSTVLHAGEAVTMPGPRPASGSAGPSRGSPRCEA